MLSGPDPRIELERVTNQLQSLRLDYHEARLNALTGSSDKRDWRAEAARLGAEVEALRVTYNATVQAVKTWLENR